MSDTSSVETSCPNEQSITVLVAGNTIRDDGKTLTLAPPIQNSDPTDCTSPNYNKFAVFEVPVEETPISNQTEWIVPPKSETEIQVEVNARVKRIELYQQKKLNRLATSPLEVPASSMPSNEKIQWVVPPKFTDKLNERTTREVQLNVMGDKNLHSALVESKSVEIKDEVPLREKFRPGETSDEIKINSSPKERVRSDERASANYSLTPGRIHVHGRLPSRTNKTYKLISIPPRKREFEAQEGSGELEIKFKSPPRRGVPRGNSKSKRDLTVTAVMIRPLLTIH